MQAQAADYLHSLWRSIIHLSGWLFGSLQHRDARLIFEEEDSENAWWLGKMRCSSPWMEDVPCEHLGEWDGPTHEETLWREAQGFLGCFVAHSILHEEGRSSGEVNSCDVVCSACMIVSVALVTIALNFACKFIQSTFPIIIWFCAPVAEGCDVII